MAMENIEELIFAINSDAEFEKMALEVFHLQKENCSVYAQYLTSLNRKDPEYIHEIPFLPISFFKTHSVKTENLPIHFSIIKITICQIVTKSERTRAPMSTQRLPFLPPSNC